MNAIRNFCNYTKNTSSTLIPWIKQLNINSTRITHATGSHIFSNNKQIIDFTCGAMAVNLGHNNPYILKGFENHSDVGISYVPSNFSTYQRDYLSDRLLGIVNYEGGKVLYGNAGADSNEMACFISQEYQSFQGKSDKNRVLTFEKSFHGGSTIAASLASGDSRRYAKEKYFNIPYEPILVNPSFKDYGEKSIQDISNKLDDSVSAIMIEGSSGTVGCILYPADYLKKIEKICRERDILMICDEVMSGFGRTGEMFAHFKQDITPDIITCAKGITSGYVPLGAVIMKNNVSDIFNDKPVMCGLTYSGHTLACTIANRCLDLYLENGEELVKNVNDKGDLMFLYGKSISNKFDWIKDYRSNGLLGCWELDLTDERLEKLSSLLLNNGIFCLRIRNHLFTAPVLDIDDDLLINTMLKIEHIFYEF